MSNASCFAKLDVLTSLTMNNDSKSSGEKLPTF